MASSAARQAKQHLPATWRTWVPEARVLRAGPGHLLVWTRCSLPSADKPSCRRHPSCLLAQRRQRTLVPPDRSASKLGRPELLPDPSLDRAGIQAHQTRWMAVASHQDDRSGARRPTLAGNGPRHLVGGQPRRSRGACFPPRRTPLVVGTPHAKDHPEPTLESDRQPLPSRYRTMERRSLCRKVPTNHPVSRPPVSPTPMPMKTHKPENLPQTAPCRGRSGWGRLPSPRGGQCLVDHVQHRLCLAQHVVIPETQHAEASRLKDRRTVRVVGTVHEVL